MAPTTVADGSDKIKPRGIFISLISTDYQMLVSRSYPMSENASQPNGCGLHIVSCFAKKIN